MQASTHTAAPGAPLAPLEDPRERLTAAHEAGHCIAALAKRADVEGLMTCRAGSAIETGESSARGLFYGVHADPVVSFAGCIGATMAAGVAYRFATVDEARIAACARRADIKQRMVDSAPQPEPGAITPSTWSDVPTDAPALSMYLHDGRGGDLVRALEHIEAGITEPDHAERQYLIGAGWDAAQAEAFRLCREWLPEIRDLAALLCDHGGSLTAEQIGAFWKDAVPRWASRQATKACEMMKRRKETTA